jgi:hypothetical protein
VQTDITDSTGAITSISSKAGRGQLLFHSLTQTLGTAGIALYIVHFSLCGRYNMQWQSFLPCCNSGSDHVDPGGGGASTGTLVAYSTQHGIATASLGGGQYAIDAASGRVTFSPSVTLPLPTLYLAMPVASSEDIQAFAVGSDSGDSGLGIAVQAHSIRSREGNHRQRHHGHHAGPVGLSRYSSGR